MICVDSTLNAHQQATAAAVLWTTTFVAGVVTLIAMSMAALVAVICFISLYFTVIVAIGSHIAALSTQADPAIKLAMLVLLVYAFVKLALFARR